MASVLIVDDDETTRSLIGVAVEQLGHHPTYAHDGEEAVELVKAKSYDVVFMDLVLPHKNGLLAMQEILAEYPSTKIVAMSGVDPEMLEQAAEYGAVVSLTKPLTPAQVQNTVEELLHGRPSGWDEGWTE